MFIALEDEVIRILRANLSPQRVPANRVVNGPIDTPAPAEFPTVAFTAGNFQLVPDDAVGPPRGSRALVEDAFTGNGNGPLALSRPPLQPLRAVEVQETTGGDRVLLRERDDYTIDYVNRQLRLRQAPEGAVRVQYFTLQPLQVVSATRLRVECQLEVWASTAAGDQHVDTIATVALGAIAANTSAIDGLLTEGQDVIDSGLASVGARRVFFIFDALRGVGGTQPEPTRWQINYTADATMVLVPRDEQIGVMRHIAAGVAWDDKLAQRFLSTPPPVLGRPVTIVQGVGPVTAAALAERGITTVGQLARATPTGQAQIDDAIPRARMIEDRAREVVRRVIQSAPDIPDTSAFLDQRLADVDAGDLTGVGISATTAGEIVAALSALLAQTKAPDLALADLFLEGAP